LRYLNPEGLGKLVANDTAYWAKIIKTVGIKLD
jgi:hypothetical protein